MVLFLGDYPAAKRQLTARNRVSERDRVLAGNPNCSMVLLLRRVINSGAPPALARLPMTPEEVAASNDELEWTPPAPRSATLAWYADGTLTLPQPPRAGHPLPGEGAGASPRVTRGRKTEEARLAVLPIAHDPAGTYRRLHHERLASYWLAGIWLAGLAESANCRWRRCAGAA
jgi:hypothetical protein